MEIRMSRTSLPPQYWQSEPAGDPLPLGSLRVAKVLAWTFHPKIRGCFSQNPGSLCSQPILSCQYLDQTEAQIPNRTFNLLFSFCNSRHKVSNFCFILVCLLSSLVLWSFSFCNSSARFWFFRLFRSHRFTSVKCSVTRFWRKSIFCRSSIFEVRVLSSRFARLTSRSSLYVSKISTSQHLVTKKCSNCNPSLPSYRYAASS